MSIKRLFRRFLPNWGNGQHRPSRKKGGRDTAVSGNRKLRLEQFEQRMLLAITGPELVSIIPNAGDTIEDGDVLDIAPRELLFGFNEGQRIDASSLGGIQIVRSGGDGGFGDGNEVMVEYGWIGLADRPNEVIVRFADTLPDDLYHINLIGSGPWPLRNTDGDPFNEGGNVTIEFDLDLGPQVVAIVPQPVTRDVDGQLQQDANKILVYFNDDDLDAASAQTPDFYQLFVTQGTADPADDVLVSLDPSDPDCVVYDPVANSVVLTYPDDLSTYGTGAFRLRIGNEYQALQTLTMAVGIVDAGPLVQLDATTLQAVPGSALVDGDTFTITDGFGTQVFEFEDLTVGDDVTPGNVRVEFDPGYTADQVAAAVADAVNRSLALYLSASASTAVIAQDLPGVIVTPTTGLATTESGGTAQFTVVLTSQPAADVIIGISSDDLGEGTVAPALTFAPANWNVSQVVTVTGVDDAVNDGDVTYTILTDPATSADPDYAGLDPDDVLIRNVDDDLQGIIVTPVSGLVTREWGGMAQFTITLASPPTANVTIDLWSDDLSEGTVFPDRVTFTPGTWNLRQAVTVTGVDDGAVDGDMAYKIMTDPAVSGDPTYDGIDPPDVSVTNWDNDVPPFTQPGSGFVPDDSGDPIVGEFVSHGSGKSGSTGMYLPPQENLFEPGGFLTGPSSDAPLDVAMDYLTGHAADLGLAPADLDHFIVTDQYTSGHTGVTHVYLAQTFGGLEVMAADVNVNVTADGEVINVGSSFVAGLGIQQDTADVEPTLTAPEALEALAAYLGLPLDVTPAVIGSVGDLAQTTVLAASGISLEDVPAELVFVPRPDGGVELGWKMNVQTVGDPHWYDAVVSATDGNVRYVSDWIDGAQYEVFAIPDENPDDTSPPATRTIVVDPQDATASPYGWHDTDGVAGAEFTDTRGNNVFAQEDRNADFAGGTRPDGGASLDFTGTVVPLDLSQAPSTYTDAATANLFYWANLLHDIHYQYGFDEASGNFQVNNYGNGGLGNDQVDAYSQWGADVGQSDNAFMGTPADGSSPYLCMLEFTYTTPRRDSAFESQIIVHEFGHGVSNRLTGGPSDANALNALQSGGMGEGWSDWHSLMFTQKAADGKMDAYPTGNYVLGLPPNGPGIRRYPYSYDMAIDPLTYDDFNGGWPNNEVHNAGEIWCSVLWDLNWLLIDQYGFDPDLYNGTGGNNLAMQLVMDGLKLQPANPSFLDGRDAILLADQLLTGGANSLAIWTAFARRGMGFSAYDGGSANAETVVAAFDMPATSAGIIELDASQYEVGDPVTITVRDSDLAGTGAIDVPLISTGGDSELVTLTEMITAAGVFRASIPTALSPFTSYNGTLEVLAGNVLTVFYNDADDGTGNPALLTDTADVVEYFDIFTQDFESGLGPGEIVSGAFTVNNTNAPLNNGTMMMGHPASYANNDYSYYEVTVDLGGFTGVRMLFDYAGHIEDYWDGFNVQASTGPISPPNDLITAISGLPYDAQSSATPAAIGPLAYDTNGSLDFGTALFDLSAFDGQVVNLRFQFGSDGSVTNPGINIDNLVIEASGVPTAGGITVTPTAGLVTRESGGSALFTVVLDSAPLAPVTVGISSSDTTEGAVSAASLTFTPADWYVAQTVVVTTVDDAIDDGDVTYSIVTNQAVSSDPIYNGMPVPDVSITNLDNDATVPVVELSLAAQAAGTSFATALELGDFGGLGGPQAVIVPGDVRANPFGLSMPGGLDEPGHRHIPPESHYLFGSVTGEEGVDYAAGQLMVRFQDGVGEQEQADILAAHGLVVENTLDSVSVAVVSLPAGVTVESQVAALAQNEAVLYAEPDYFVTPTVLPNDPSFDQLWGMHNTGQLIPPAGSGTPDADIDAPEAWDTFTGSSEVIVAVIDTGVDYRHPDLAANMWQNPGETGLDEWGNDKASNQIDDDGNGWIDDVYGIDAANGDGDPFDDGGHGTHCAGTIAAVGNDGIGVAGVNWDAKIMALKFLAGSGGGLTSWAIQVLEYMTMMKRVYGQNIVVSSNSWGGGGYSQSLENAIRDSVDMGILFVAAAGNDGLDNDTYPHYPSSYDLDGIIAVAATDGYDDLATSGQFGSPFDSNYGANTVDLGAPGVNILSTTPNNSYAYYSGTSMATPHVAGVATLLAAYNPSASVADIKQAILDTVDPLSSLQGKVLTDGRLNAAAALARIGTLPSTPLGSVRVAYYNFQDYYGRLPSGDTPSNAITENQKERAREIFEIYSYYLGIEFVETDSRGLTVVTGDMRAVEPTVPIGVGGISDGSLGGRVVMNANLNWGNSEYGGGWFQTAMHEIGHSLGLGHTYDLPSLTIMGDQNSVDSNRFPDVGEPVFPGDADLVHARSLFPPASTDVDLYQFEVTDPGWFTAEVTAERLQPSASLLNSELRLYRETDDGGTLVRELIARNDDYFSNDSYIGLDLEAGDYYIAVTSTGVRDLDPTIPDTGFGGTSEGPYELKLSLTPRPDASLVDADGSATPLDGDSDGVAGGVFDFWFDVAIADPDQAINRTLFVDKLADRATADGTLAHPFTEIDVALIAAASGQGDIVRIVGNNFDDDDPTDPDTLLNNLPYLVGQDMYGFALPDGRGIAAPKGVTVMIDAGVLLKLYKANVEAGSSDVGIDRSGGALQVLGTPDDSVYFRSYRNDAAGGDSDGPSAGPASGDWGGLVFRADSDYEEEGIFLNWVNHADINNGGGKVFVGSVEDVYTPVHVSGARPTIAFNKITKSADAAISADLASFEETSDRVGPDVHGNRLLNNTINGLFVRIQTQLGSPTETLEVPARWDDTDIVHVVTENLVIQGTPCGPQQVGGDFQARIDGRLAVDPGVIVKLEAAHIDTGIGAQLIAEGLFGYPVVFTSLKDDRFGAGGTFDTSNDGDQTSPAPGQWGGLVFRPASRGSLDHALVAHAGGTTPVAGDLDQFNAVEIYQADVRIANSTLKDNASGRSNTNRNGLGYNTAATIFVRGAQPILLNNVIADNAADAVSINANAMQSGLVEDWGRATGLIDAFTQFGDNHGPLIHLNRLQNNGTNGLVIRGAVLTTECVWDDTDIAHVLRGEIKLLNHHTFSGLRLESDAAASLVVKLGAGAGFTADGVPLDINDRIGGTLHVLGIPGRPVILTSLADDTAVAGFDVEGNRQGDTNNDGDSSGQTGDWRSIRIDQYANSRNVGVALEQEPAYTAGDDENRFPGVAQFLGNLAPDPARAGETIDDEKGGDDDRRLGFEVHGFISLDDPTDVDVYSFTGYGGSEVWIDVDRSGYALDSVVELVLADGTVLASSDNSGDLATITGLLGPEGLTEYQFLGGDFYTTNALDAGMRVVLPGQSTTAGTYFVRVSSHNGQTRGQYQMQIRLRQVDEFPGCTVRYADIRYATDGIEVLGMPGHSPLFAETADQPGDTNNEGFAQAQRLGNLLTADRNTIGVAGDLNVGNDVDWYRFTIDYDLIQAIGGFNAGDKTWATVFDIDYADGIARPDATIAVFEPDGTLILVSRDSNVEDDQRAGSSAGFDDLTRGSFGSLDPFIGTQQMPAGVVPVGSTREYYVAISSNAYLPTGLEATFSATAAMPLIRLEPIDSVQRIAEDHIGFSGYISGFPNMGAIPRYPDQDLFDITSEMALQAHVVPYTLDDVVLFVSTPGSSGRLYTLNPFTGDFETNVGQIGNFGDIAMRGDGSLYGETRGNNNGNSGNFRLIDTADGSTTNIGDDGIGTNPDVGGEWEALTFRRIGNANFEAYAANNETADNDDNAGNGMGYPAALYRINQSNGNAIDESNADGLQPVGLLPDLDPDPLIYLPDEIMGLAFASPSSSTLYAVSDTGNLWQTTIYGSSSRRYIDPFTGWTLVRSDVTGTGAGFTGLTLGPQNLDVLNDRDADGDGFPDELPDGLANLASTLFATADNYQLYAFDFAGNPQTVFDTDHDGLADSGSTYIGYSTTGLAFSPLDFNLWHPTEFRTDDAGHGINDAFDYSRAPAGFGHVVGGLDSRPVWEDDGGVSFYFGLENWVNNPYSAERYLRYHQTNPWSYPINAQLGFFSSNVHRDLTSNANIGDNYNLPGGALGSLATNTFSLEGYTRKDKPTLYFNYFLETEGANSRTNTMRDSARVFLLSNDGTTWNTLATNNSMLDEELPPFISVSSNASSEANQRVQELFDNTGGWRQARIDLSEFAGQANLQLRFDFHTAGDTDKMMPGDEYGNFNDEERGQDNLYQGFFVDDIIIGFAERGEMVTGPSDMTTYFQVPQNPDPFAPQEVLTGPYQLEIRRGTEYGATLTDLGPQIAIFNTFDTDDRLIEEMRRLGDRNLQRPQDQLQIYGNTITDASGFGIVVDAGQRGGLTDMPYPGSVRNLPTLNNQRLVPGVTIVNNVIANNGQGGISFSGDANPSGVPDAAVPYGRIVNNTIVGNTEPTVGQLQSLVDFETIPGGDPVDGMVIYDQFLATHGVTFYYEDGSYPLLAEVGAPTTAFAPNDTPDPSAAGQVGRFFLTDNDGTTGKPTSNLIVEYSPPTAAAAGVLLDMDGLGNTVEQWTIEALDANGQVLQTVVLTSGEPGTGDGMATPWSIDVGTPVIQRIRFIATGDKNPALYGFAMDNFFARGVEAQGTGILVEYNASPTILNNIVASTALGISIDASCGSTVVAANLFKDNDNDGVVGSNPIMLTTAEPLFVNEYAGNFYLAPGSRAIDSSLNSLSDRPSLVAVKSPLGISPSPILAPERDRYDQLRVDDPSQDPPPGTGYKIFKDRGAVERADFVQPTARLFVPEDNGILDFDPDDHEAIVVAQRLTELAVRLLDTGGIGIDDSSVVAETVVLYQTDGPLPDDPANWPDPLVVDEDYLFEYDRVDDVISLIAAEGIWLDDMFYTIILDNTPGIGIRDMAGNALAVNRGADPFAGMTVFTVELTGFDFGDAPDPDYPSLLDHDGARHLVSGAYLGSDRDREPDALQNADASGDGSDDDGVRLESALWIGNQAEFTVTASADGYLNAWIDFNADGDWSDAGEQVFTNQFLVAGDTLLPVTVPDNTVVGLAPGELEKLTFGRFRFNSDGKDRDGNDLSYDGVALDGEVEDYQLRLLRYREDYGDAPEDGGAGEVWYPTRAARAGASHFLDPAGPFLGAGVDPEVDGQPDATATGDDLNGDDEDGVVLPPVLIAGGTTTIEVDMTASPVGGLLDAWVDFDRDGYWGDVDEDANGNGVLDPGEDLDGDGNLDVDEQIFAGQPLTVGINSLQFDVPADVPSGFTFTRFRVSSAGGLSYDGAAADGEVEDYQVGLGHLPIAHAGGPYVISEGQDLGLDASGSSDPDGDSLTFAWDLDNDGQFDDAVGESPVVPWATLAGLGLPTDGTLLPIAVEVDDGLGGVDTATSTLMIINVDPIADAGGLYVINEGQDLALDASGSIDPGGDSLTYAWDLDDDGQFDDAVGVNPVIPWATLVGLGLPSNGMPLPISVEADDGEGGVDTDSTTLSIVNLPPTANANGPYVINEGQDLALDASGSSDPGGDALTYAWDLDADGQFDDASGMNPTVSWATLASLGLASDGTPLSIAVEADDGEGGVTVHLTTLTINNLGPTADADGPYVINEGEDLALDATASSDPGGDSLTFAWDLDADGQFDDAAGMNPVVPWATLAGLGLPTDGTTVPVALQVDDGQGGVHTDATTLTINNVPPTADAGGPYVINEGEDLALDATGSSDPGGDSLTYAWDLDADGQFDDAIGVSPVVPWATLAGLGLASDGTALPVGVEVDDGEGGLHTHTTTLIINNVAPEVAADNPSVTVDEGQTAANTGTFLDVGGDAVTISASVGSVNQIGTQSGTWDWSFDTTDGPTESQTVTITATDSDGAATSTTFILTVVNVAPDVTADQPSVTVDEGQTAANTGTFSDPGDDVVTISASVGSVNQIGTQSGTWDWSFDTTDGPTESQTVTITATDSDGAATSTTFSLTVDNVAPSVDAGDDQSADEGAPVSFSGAFNDPGSADTHMITWDFGDGGSALDTLMPTHVYADDGVYTVTLTVEDDDGGVGVDTLTMTVNNVAPDLAADNPSVTVDEGQTAANTGTFSDPGDDAVTISASIGAVTQVGTQSGTWSWSFDTTDGPDESQPVIITADDGEGGVSTTTFTLTVNNVAPVVGADNPSVTVDEGQTAANTGTFSDVGDDVVILSASVGTVTWMGTQSGTWSWSFATTDGLDESQMVAITATDSDGAATVTTFSMTVVNVAPDVAADQPSVTVDEGQTAANTGTFSDPGDDVVTISASIGTVTQVGTQSGTWDWSFDTTDGPTESQTVTITATDSDGDATSTTFSLTVDNVAPTVDAGADQSADEAAVVSFSGSFTDPGSADTHIASWDFGDGGTAFGTLAPTHVYADDGVYLVTLTVEDDDGGEGFDTLTVTVNNVAPEVAADNPLVIVDEGQTAANTGTFSDVGDDVVTISASVGTVTQVGTQSGTWSWSFDTTDGPAESQAVTITADDGEGGVTTTTFVLTVNNVAPEVAADLPLVAVDEAQTAGNTGTFSDVGDDVVTISASVGTVTQVGTQSGTWSWSFDSIDGPDESQVVTITADDGEGGVTTTTFVLRVDNVAPEVAADSPSVTVDEAQTAGNTGTFSDVGDDAVTISASVGTVTQVGTQSGTWDWSFDTTDGPDQSQTVMIWATDSDGAVTMTVFTLTVDNVAPEVAADSPSVTVDEGQTATNTGTFSDVGDDVVTISASIGTATQVGAQSGTWSWSFTTSDGPAENQTVTIMAADSDGAVGTTTFSLTVDNVAPTVDAGADQAADEGAIVSFSGSLTDPGSADTHTITWEYGDGAEASGTLTPSHVYADDGVYTVTLTVEDDDGGMDVDTLTVTVANVAPEVTAASSLVIVSEGQTAVNGGSFSDAGDDVVTISASAGAVTQTGVQSGSWGWSFASTDGPAESQTITVTADDNEGGVNSTTFMLIVNNVGPTAAAGGPYFVDAGGDVTLDGSGSSDPGNDIVLYEWDLDGDGEFGEIGVFAERGDEIGISPTFSAAGLSGPSSLVVTLRVTDESGVADDDSAVVWIAQPLGPVDYSELKNLNPSAADLWYSVQTVRQGFLTITSSHSGGAVTLYDANVNPLTPGANQRVDWQAGAGEKYYFKVSGTSGNVDLKLANLVSHVGTEVAVYGTASGNPATGGNDRFTYDAAASRRITINGVPYVFDDAEVTSVTFDGDEGRDTVVLNGSTADEAVTLLPDRGVLTGNGCTVTATNVETTTANSGGGTDVAKLYDSDGNDTFRAGPRNPLGAMLTGISTSGRRFTNAVNAFSYVHAFATAGGIDTAVLSDSVGNDSFVGKPSEAILQGTGFFNRAYGFEQVSATSTAGEDTAKLYDSAGSDVLDAAPQYGKLRFDGSQSHFVQATGFRYLFGYAENNGTDVANLSDSSTSDDLLIGTPGDTVLYGSSFYSRAYGFEQVNATATPGQDIARLYDSAGPDFFDAGPQSGKLEFDGSQEHFVHAAGFRYLYAFAIQGGSDEAGLVDSSSTSDVLVGTPSDTVLYGPSFYSRAYGFEQVSATASPGEDIARLYDSTGSDALEATPEHGKLEFGGSQDHFVQADGFRYLYAYAVAGGRDTADLADSSSTNDVFVGKPSDTVLYGPNFYSRAYGFEQVNATASPGEDVARLYDSAGSDSLEATPQYGKLKYDGSQDHFVRADGFRYLYAHASLGQDTAEMADSASSKDEFVGMPGDSVLSGPGFYNRVYGFEQVSATASPGEDIARLFDSAGPDALEATPQYGKLEYDGNEDHFVRAGGFRYVYAHASDGDDTAQLADSPSSKDVFVGMPGDSVLSGPGFYNRAYDFELVRAAATAGAGFGDEARLYDSHGADVFEAGPTSAKFTLADGTAIQADDFRYVHGVASPSDGSEDAATLQGRAGSRDSFVGTPTDAILQGSNFFNQAWYFDKVTGIATAGDGDVAQLFGAPDGHDTFEGNPSWSYLSYAKLYGLGFSNRALYFDEVHADALTGAYDRAYLWDSELDDILEIGGDVAKLYRAATPYLFEVAGFDYIMAESTTQGDGDTVKRTSHVFDLDLEGWWENE